MLSKMKAYLLVAILSLCYNAQIPGLFLSAEDSNSDRRCQYITETSTFKSSLQARYKKFRRGCGATRLWLRGGQLDGSKNEDETDLDRDIDLAVSKQNLLQVLHEPSMDTRWHSFNGTDLATLLFHVPNATNIVYSPSREFLAWCTSYQSVLVWNIRNVSAVIAMHEFPLPQNEVSSLAFSETGNFVAISQGQSYFQWDVNSGLLISGTVIEDCRQVIIRCLLTLKTDFHFTGTRLQEKNRSDRNKC